MCARPGEPGSGERSDKKRSGREPQSPYARWSPARDSRIHRNFASERRISRQAPRARMATEQALREGYQRVPRHIPAAKMLVVDDELELRRPQRVHSSRGSTMVGDSSPIANGIEDSFESKSFGAGSAARPPKLSEGFELQLPAALQLTATGFGSVTHGMTDLSSTCSKVFEGSVQVASVPKPTGRRLGVWARARAASLR